MRDGRDNLQVLLADRPRGLPGPDDFRLHTSEVPSLLEAEYLVRVEWASVDPAMRNWVSARPGRGEPVPVGGVMRALTVGTVIESRHPGFSVGNVLAGRHGWQQFAVCGPRDPARHVLPVPAHLPDVLGVLGHIGLTAYAGLLLVARAQPGDAVVVSSAAGAVGSLVGQLASTRGCHAVGIAGGAAKVARCVQRYGYAAAIDRRTSDLPGALREVLPSGADVYFDNVGGPTLDAVVEILRDHGRVVVCGTISLPPGPAPTGPRHERTLLDRRASITGFVLSDFADQTEAMLADLRRDVAAGRLHLDEEVVPGLTAAPAALWRLLHGDHDGKLIVAVQE